MLQAVNTTDKHHQVSEDIRRELHQVMDEIRELHTRQTILGIIQKAIQYNAKNARFYNNYRDGYITGHEMVQMLIDVPDDMRYHLAIALLEQSEAQAIK
tara:strand:- start:215 stop:511 length:297 start_codon:yes stop_codon:yes gene_type:complete